MAKTTEALTFVRAHVFVSPDDATWTDVSGHGASIAVSGGERGVGEQHVFDDDTPVMGAGKRSGIRLTVRYLYTEEVAGPFEILRTQHEIVDAPIYAQYCLDSDGFWYSTGLGILVKPGYPGGEASSPDKTVSEFIVACDALTKAAAST